jgi:hypothetical protein
MDGLMEVRRNMAAIDVVKMERDSLKLQLQASQTRAQQQQQQQQQQQLADMNAQPVEAGSSPSAFRALAISEIAEKEQAVQQLQVALDDSNNKLMQQEVLVRVRTESERQVCVHPPVQTLPCVILLHYRTYPSSKNRTLFYFLCLITGQSCPV